MRRRSFDKIVSIAGLVLAGVLAVAGALLLVGGSFAATTVHDQLAAQKIFFSSDASTLPPELQQYAGTQVTDGSQAKAFSDLIAVHLSKVADGKTYSEVSEEWLAGGSKDEALAAQRTTLFMGETLRGMLLNAYAFSIFATIATVGAWVMFGAAAVLVLLALLGFRHLRRTPEDAVVAAPAAEDEPVLV